MKKIFLIVIVLSTITLSAAPLSIKNKPVYAGGEVTLESLNYSLNDAAKNDTSYSHPVMGIGLFYDMYYLRTGLSYSFTADKGQIKSDIDTIDGDAVDYSYKFLNIDLLGKYPIKANPFELWPAIGFQYSVNMEATDENGDDFEDTDLNDFYLLAGVGLDYNINSQFVISPSVLFGYNMTPETIKDPPTNFEYSGYKFDFRIAVGYRL